MSSIVKDFKTYAVNIVIDVKQGIRGSHHILVLPARLNLLSFMNDPWYSYGNCDLRIVRDSNKIQANVDILSEAGSGHFLRLKWERYNIC